MSSTFLISFLDSRSGLLNSWCNHRNCRTEISITSCTTNPTTTLSIRIWILRITIWIRTCITCRVQVRGRHRLLCTRESLLSLANRSFKIWVCIGCLLLFCQFILRIVSLFRIYLFFFHSFILFFHSFFFSCDFSLFLDRLNHDFEFDSIFFSHCRAGRFVIKEERHADRALVDYDGASDPGRNHVPARLANFTIGRIRSGGSRLADAKVYAHLVYYCSQSWIVCFFIDSIILLLSILFFFRKLHYYFMLSCPICYYY
jgi:hypothetical protein